MVFPEQSHVKWQILYANRRERWDFRFFGFGHCLGRFFGFCVWYGFAFFFILAFGFQFSAKIQAVFRIWYPTEFSVLPVWSLVSGFLNHERVPREPNADVTIERKA